MNRKLIYNPKHENLDYLRGIILSDGHIRIKDGVRISTTNKDFATHFQLLGYSVTQYLNNGYKPGSIIYYIRIGNVSFAHSLGFDAGEKTHHFQPNSNWSISNPWEFISGMIDGDGTVSKTRAAIELAISCKDILEVIESVYKSVGVTKYGIYKRNESAYNLYVKNRESEKIFLDNLSLRYLPKATNVALRKSTY